jgi:DNA-binding transcriptional regulator PaaX
MLLHTPQVGDVERPERPERLTTIMKLFDDFGVENRCVRTPVSRCASGIAGFIGNNTRNNDVSNCRLSGAIFLRIVRTVGTISTL